MWHWDLGDWERGPWIEWKWDGEAPEPMLFLSDTFLALRGALSFSSYCGVKRLDQRVFLADCVTFSLVPVLVLVLEIYNWESPPSLSFSVRESEREGGGGATMEESNDKSTPYLPNEHNMKNGYVSRIVMRKNPCLALPCHLACNAAPAVPARLPVFLDEEAPRLSVEHPPSGTAAPPTTDLRMYLSHRRF